MLPQYLHKVRTTPSTLPPFRCPIKWEKSERHLPFYFFSNPRGGATIVAHLEKEEKEGRKRGGPRTFKGPIRELTFFLSLQQNVAACGVVCCLPRSRSGCLCFQCTTA